MASLFGLASQVLFHLGARFPLFFPRLPPYIEFILEQTILIFTRSVFVERFSCFRDFVIRWMYSGNIRLLSTCGWRELWRGTMWKGRDAALQRISGMFEIDFGEFPISPILGFSMRVFRMCLPTWFDDSLLAKGNAAKFIDALLNCVVMLI